MGWLDQWHPGGGFSTLGGIVDPDIITSFSPTHAIGPSFDQSTVPSTAVWPSASQAVFMPFTLSATFVATTMAVVNGAAVSGNVDMGIYDVNGARLASNGGAAQAGTTTLQLLQLSASVTLQPFTLYLMALVLDNGVGQVHRIPTGSEQRMAGVQAVAASYPLPANVALAGGTAVFYPALAVARRTSF